MRSCRSTSPCRWGRSGRTCGIPRWCAAGTAGTTPGLDAEIRRLFVDGAVESQDVIGDETIHTLTLPHARQAHPAVRRAPAAPHAPDRHAAQPPGPRPLFDGVRDEIDEGWIAFAHQLQFALSIHPDQDRRTLSVFGLDAGERGNRLLDRAGLMGIHGVPVGGHVQARRPDGTLLGGT